MSAPSESVGAMDASIVMVRLGALEREISDLHARGKAGTIANSGPMGLFAFGLTTSLLQVYIACRSIDWSDHDIGTYV